MCPVLAAVDTSAEPILNLLMFIVSGHEQRVVVSYSTLTIKPELCLKFLCMSSGVCFSGSLAKRPKAAS